MAHTSAKITAEEWALGITGVVLLGGGLYLLDRRGILHIPGLPSSTATKTPPSLDIAPQNLPNVVPADHRCGTVYVSFGQSTNRPGYIIVGKYSNGKLVAQYYQPASDAPNFNAAGSWAGGVACSSSVSRTPVRTTRVTPTPSNVYGWTYVGTKTVNGRTAKCYVAQNGATLSGLQVITGVYYGTIASQNGIQNPNDIQIGQTVCVATGAAASTPKTTPRSGFPQLRVAAQVLPSSVTTNRCGTVYYSYGMSSVAGYAVIAKYVNTKLVAQYYQAVSNNSPWRNKGYHTGGSACASTTPKTTPKASQCKTGYFARYESYDGTTYCFPAFPLHINSSQVGIKSSVISKGSSLVYFAGTVYAKSPPSIPFPNVGTYMVVTYTWNGNTFAFKSWTTTNTKPSRVYTFNT